MSTTSKLYTFHELMTDGLVTKHDGKEVRCKIDRILIPMIQRPYAQGRKSQKSIREKFLHDIFAALANNDVEKLELNFIYGTFIEEGEKRIFQLLDGQQRLTTLFLLHWYVAARDTMCNDATTSLPEYLKNFEYQTRTTSTAFLKKLVSAKLCLGEKPSKTIRQALWYSKTFDKDTTIVSMLRMLDAINDKYESSERKPTYESLQKLKFYVLELNGFGLSEELFIKMNARGLQLTPFENFKADLVGYMKKQYTYLVPMTLSVAKREVPYWLNFSSLIDGRWVNLFWTKPNDDDDSGSKACDKRFFRFIQRFFANKSILLAEKSKETNLVDDPLFSFFTQNTEVERHFGFEQYEAIIVKGKKQGVDLLRQLEHLLNFLCDENVGAVLLNALTAPWELSRDWQPWSISSEKMGRRQMILLSVLFEYVDHIASIDQFNEEKFLTWMRFAHVMVQNTDINQLMPQITLTRLLNDALCFQPKGDSLFCAWQHPYEAIVGFNDSRRDNRYLENEASKARQIINDDEWKKAFRLADTDPFMQGFVTFYYEEGMSASAYRNRTNNVRYVFNKGGVVDNLAKNYLLIRAVLCRNVDWMGIKKNMTNFNITNRGADRHLRNLTIWNTQPEVKRLFCQLLDCQTDTQRLSLLESVANEVHNIMLRTDGYWSDEAKENLQCLYNRLHSIDEMKVMTWLYDTGINMMGVWINADGTGSLYKGPVNCVMVTSNRHKVIPYVVERYKDIFHFSYADDRPLNALTHYNVFSGSEVVLYSGPDALPDNVRLKLIFLSYGQLCIHVVGSGKKAKALYEAYKAQKGNDNLYDRYGNNIEDADGNLNFYMNNATECYRVCYLPDACTMPINNLYALLDMAHRILSTKRIVYMNLIKKEK